VVLVDERRVGINNYDIEKHLKELQSIGDFKELHEEV